MQEIKAEKIISVKVFPSAKKEKVIKKSKDALEVYLKEPPQNNLANKRLLFVLSKEFSVPENKLKIITGHRSFNKKIAILA